MDGSTEELVGTMVGDYQITGLVGEGGMGRVFEGVHPVIGKRVAVKLLRKDLAKDPAEAQRLLAEARLVNAIGHRGIIDIFGFGATPQGSQYFVMEFLPGSSLSEHIRTRAPLPIDETLQVLEELLSALDAAHRAAVVHRDVKPSNIFLVDQPDGSTYVKVLDFGIAKQALFPHESTPQTNASKVPGTPHYMAPEQALGDEVGPRTDLYAVGVVAFQMLTGRLPFDGKTPFDVINNHLNRPPPVLSSIRSDVPEQVDRLVLALLAKSPQERPATAQAVRARIAKLRQELKLAATRLVPRSGVAAAPFVLRESTARVDVPVPSPRPATSRWIAGGAVAAVAVLGGVWGVISKGAPAGRDTATVISEAPAALGSPREETAAAQLAVARAPSETVMGAPREAVGGALREAAGGAPREAVGGAPREAVGGAPREAVGGAPREAPARAPSESPARTPSQAPALADTTRRAEPASPSHAAAPQVSPSRLDKSDADSAKKLDPVETRYRRVNAKWLATRAAHSPEDQRLFDLMMDQIGKQLASGTRGEASRALNDFVRAALQGHEP